MKPALFVALCLVAGCASMNGTGPSGSGGNARTFEAPMARVKPAFISSIVSAGMAVSALEVRGGREVIRARKSGSEVEIELESVSRSVTRARVAATSGDAAAAARILQQAGKILSGS